MNRFTSLSVVSFVVWIVVGGAATALAAAPFDAAEDFFDENCSVCHNNVDLKGGLDLGALQYDPEDRENFARWIKIHDRVKAGEMPPAGADLPPSSERESFVGDLAASLIKSEKEIYARDGRSMLRRLNRYEYENAVRDLLHVPWAEIKEKLPEDGEAYRFNKIGRALDVSHVQMARYMSSADYAMKEAMRAALDRPEKTTNRYYARDEGSLTGSFVPREGGTLPDRHSFPVLDSHAQPDVRNRRAPISSPETREREAVGKVSSIFSDSGGYSWSQFRAPAAGRYRLRFKGYTIWVSGGGISRWYFEGFGREKAPVYYLPLWHRPNVDEIWPGRNDEPMSVFAQGSSQNRMIGEFDFHPEPSESEMVVMLRAGEVVRTDASRFFRTRVNGTGEQYVNPLATEHGLPGYAIQWMEVEGPLEDDAYDAGYKLMFDDLEMVTAEDGEPGVALESASRGRGGGRGGRGGGRGGRGAGGRGGGRGAAAGQIAPAGRGAARGALATQDEGGQAAQDQPAQDEAAQDQGAFDQAARGQAPGAPAARGGRGFAGQAGGGGPAAGGQAAGGRGRGGQRGGGGRGGFGRGGFGGAAQNVIEVHSDAPEQDAQRLLRRFMARAYRRPVEDSEVQLYFDLFKDQYAKDFGFAQSMISAYTAVLASPGFIFVEESPGKLDDFALATRLSLFLWNSEPDDELRDLAARGELSRPEVLRAQTERLLDDPKSRRFVEAFTDYWLDIREIDDNSPSTTLYNDYELDDPLKLAAVEETRLFVAELLKEDLPARDIVDSDFTFLNERLAKHYGIDGVEGTQMRKVTLPEDSVRGGLMTQASVLKVTANGTTTSPVLRGVWINERILGFETPPPPKVPAVEPDIRGAVTIRQQIEAHRADPSCAVCHDRMDPPGLALESFDVMGAWRDRYRAVNDQSPAEPGVGLDGQVFKFHYALPVDDSGELQDGREFADVRDLKRLLLVDETAIAQNVVKQLAIYATGAPIGFSDRQELEDILERSKSSHYGMRTIVHQIVESEMFQNK